MAPSRREVLTAALAVTLVPGTGLARVRDWPSGSIGLVIHSFPARLAGDRDLPPDQRFADPTRFFEYSRSLGAKGIQVGLGVRDPGDADKLRARIEAASMDVEAIVSPPKDEADVDRFDAEIRTARRVGATVARTALLSGRRYETFATLSAFRDFKERAARSLKLAVPSLDRHGVRLAVENHKDFRADELMALLGQTGSDRVGVCLDLGNNLALLEDPVETVEALAPSAITTHLKDMGVEESEQGFRIAEVPLGTGVLDLPRLVGILRKAHPRIPLNLEMITRNPLEIPCLTVAYWATFPDLPARVLAKALASVRKRRPTQPLPTVARLGQEDRLRLEEENIRLCLAYAREHL